MKIILLISSLFLSNFMFATICTSVQDGDWGNATTWDNGVPGCGDTIYVNHFITIEASYDFNVANCLPMYLEISGTLYFSHPSKLALPPGSGVNILSGGKLSPEKDSGKSSLLSIGGANVWVAKDGDKTGPINYGSPLPIELIQFSATFNKNRVDIYWSTASEVNNEVFIIENSKDGFNWQTVSIVSGAGNSASIINYFEQDLNPYKGVSYYRLTQVDYNGSRKTFNVVPVENISKGQVAFKIFPNPTTQGNINLSFEGFENEEILVIVRDIQGKEHYSKASIVSENHEIQLLTVGQTLPSGIYLVTASSVNSLYSQKVVIK